MDTNTTATDRLAARLRWAHRDAVLTTLVTCTVLLFVAIAGSVALTLFCALGCVFVEVLNARTRAVIAENTLLLQG